MEEKGKEGGGGEKGPGQSWTMRNCVRIARHRAFRVE